MCYLFTIRQHLQHADGVGFIMGGGWCQTALSLWHSEDAGSPSPLLNLCLTSLELFTVGNATGKSGLLDRCVYVARERRKWEINAERAHNTVSRLAASWNSTLQHLNVYRWLAWIRRARPCLQTRRDASHMFVTRVENPPRLYGIVALAFSDVKTFILLFDTWVELQIICNHFRSCSLAQRYLSPNVSCACRAWGPLPAARGERGGSRGFCCQRSSTLCKEFRPNPNLFFTTR